MNSPRPGSCSIGGINWTSGRGATGCQKHVHVPSRDSPPPAGQVARRHVARCCEFSSYCCRCCCGCCCCAVVGSTPVVATAVAVSFGPAFARFKLPPPAGWNWSRTLTCIHTHTHKQMCPGCKLLDMKVFNFKFDYQLTKDANLNYLTWIWSG